MSCIESAGSIEQSMSRSELKRHKCTKKYKPNPATGRARSLARIAFALCTSRIAIFLCLQSRVYVIIRILNTGQARLDCMCSPYSTIPNQQKWQFIPHTCIYTNWPVAKGMPQREMMTNGCLLKQDSRTRKLHQWYIEKYSTLQSIQVTHNYNVGHQ